MSQITVQQLLDQVSFSLGTLREAKKKFSAQLAPDFHIFDYLRDDEMGLSKCFADLLNRNGKHGQGSLYLDSFLKLIDWTVGATNCQVEVEKQANGMRRIDVFLRCDEGLIGIENKPWASDQKDQLRDYANYLADSVKGKQWKLIYLCNEEPSADSISADERLDLKHHFAQLSYDDIVDWLETCAAHTKALTVRVYVEELAKFIRHKINREMAMDETNEMIKIMSASDKSLEAAFGIAKALQALKEQTLNEFKTQLEHALANETGIAIDKTTNWNDKGDPWWNVSDTTRYTGFTIWLSTQKFDQVALRFSFENKNYRGFFWGITSYALKRPTPDQTKSVAIFELLKPHYQFGEPRPNDWWTFWAWPSSTVGWGKNWDTQAKPWMAIKNKTLAAEIIDFAKLIRNHLNQVASPL